MNRAARLKAEFIDNCHDVVRRAHHVKVNEAALLKFAKSLKVPAGDAYGWHEYLSAEALADPVDPARVFHDLLVVTAQNAGYLYKNEKSDTAKWEIDGSGAKALVALFNGLRADNVLTPGATGHLSPAQAEKLKMALEGKPLAKDRLALFEETAYGRCAGFIDAILDRAKTGQGYRFDMDTVEMIAGYFPKAYGDDPYRKKAFLLCFMLAGHLESRGIKVALENLAVPADYRIPETLNTAGVLEFSDELLARIARNELMVEDDPLVSEIRAASIIAVEKICIAAKLPVAQVDLALWLACRDGTLDRLRAENPAVKAAGRHFACRTLWF